MDSPLTVKNSRSAPSTGSSSSKSTQVFFIVVALSEEVSEVGGPLRRVRSPATGKLNRYNV